MSAEVGWSGLDADLQYGFRDHTVEAPKIHHPQLVINDEDATALRVIRQALASSTDFSWSVAFVTPAAIAMLKQELVDFRGNGVIVTSDYLGFNQPAAFAELLSLQRFGISTRVHPSSHYHPKGYLFANSFGYTALVGSSNLTANALAKNHEWNLLVRASPGSDLARQFRHAAVRQFEDSDLLTQEWLDAYSQGYQSRVARSVPRPSRAAEKIEPNAMQAKALASLRALRASGERRGLVISATGTGKTILSALDVRDAAPQRMLFLVHREEILDKTMREFERVMDLPPSQFGKLSGSSKEADARFTFATVQTFSRDAYLQSVDPGDYEYVIIDEAHRAGGASYRKIIDHLRPKFLLGMTATPERMDGFNVFELFDYNIAYEIRLGEALASDMLSPFHYYGITDVMFDDGTTVEDGTGVSDLASPRRVAHLIEAMETYGQAGVPPRGLIFCSSVKEAHALSEQLNSRNAWGRRLRTRALSGHDTVEDRQSAIDALVQGNLDYVLTVDIFNEGVDIPSVNQVIMLRQTKSAIVFVQQLGRGLRKSEGKKYVVVIDFIGNYANNFMIPMALFGDESLSKESLRQRLLSTEESGLLPGVSTVHFDQVSQSRILRSITQTNLSAQARLSSAVRAMERRVGRPPLLHDFLKFESVDPVTLALADKHFPRLRAKALKSAADSGARVTLSPREDQMLDLVSREVLTSRRRHEFVALEVLLRAHEVGLRELARAMTSADLPVTPQRVQSVVDTLTLVGHTEGDIKRYGRGIADQEGDRVRLTSEFLEAYRTNNVFREAVDDVIATGTDLVMSKYDETLVFTHGMQYSSKEVTRLLNLPRKWVPTLYGYKTEPSQGVCPIFVTLHKSVDVSASTAYADALNDTSSMHWSTRSRKTLASEAEGDIAANRYELHVFAKKDDGEGTERYYLGRATASNAYDTTMPGKNGEELSVVHMTLTFDRPMSQALHDYFNPVVTADHEAELSPPEQPLLAPC